MRQPVWKRRENAGVSGVLLAGVNDIKDLHGVREDAVDHKVLGWAITSRVPGTRPARPKLG